MGVRHTSADTNTMLGEETIDVWTCYVVESVPKEQNSEFAKTISYVVKDEWIGLRKEFLAADGSVVRRLGIDEYAQIDGIWVITDMTMGNLAKGTSTRITMDEVSFNTTLRDSFCSERQMSIGPRT
jgi:outer membrane lipoprotein-sorting protein